MKTCRRIRKRLSAFVDGEVGERERTELEEHIHTCSRCQKEAEELSHLRLRLGEIEKLPSAPHLWPTILAAVSRVRRERSSFFPPSLRALRPVPVAVMALTIIVIGLWAGANLGTIIYQRSFYITSPPFDSASYGIDYLSVFDPAPAGSVGQVYIETAADESDIQGGFRQ